MSLLSPLTLKGRWKRLIVFFSYDPGFQDITFEWWLSGYKSALCPYLRGRIRLWLLQKTCPKQIRLPSFDAFSVEIQILYYVLLSILLHVNGYLSGLMHIGSS